MWWDGGGAKTPNKVSHGGGLVVLRKIGDFSIISFLGVGNIHCSGPALA